MFEPLEDMDIDYHLLHQVVQAVRSVYDYNAAGGGLHVMLDDGNTADSDVEWLENWLAEQEGSVPWYQQEAERHCLVLFKHLSQPQRDYALAVCEGR